MNGAAANGFAAAGDDEGPTVEGAVAATLDTMLNKAGCAVDQCVRDYVASVSACLLEDTSSFSSFAATCNALQDEIKPSLDSFVGDGTIATLCEGLVRLVVGSSMEGGSEDGREYLVKIDGIILAFAGRVLLRRTDLRLEKGHVYGLVGRNGTGKTTLMNRIDARDIMGFPQDIKVVYIKHEIVNGNQTPLQFMRLETEVGDQLIHDTLTEIGFSEKQLTGLVGELSGGWKMKLSIARAMLQDADLLLADEPTNHLDKKSIDWLAGYFNKQKATTLLVTHDAEFMDRVVTDIAHIEDQTLTYYKGNFSDFRAVKPEVILSIPTPEEDAAAEAAGEEVKAVANEEELAAVDKPINMDNPGGLDGVRGKKIVMRMEHVDYAYTPGGRVVLNDINVKLTLTSRVAILGGNGAGKTTMLKLLVGEIKPERGVGEVWKHHNLRVAYIAQHSMHHLEASLENTPNEYIQKRFHMGKDKEVTHKSTLELTDEEKETCTQRGEISEVIGRREKGNQLEYELVKVGRREGDTVWEPLEFLKKPPYKTYVMKLVEQFDEKMKAYQSGLELRPLTQKEILAHLANYGIDYDLAHGKIRRMSGGQRSRLVLAAAMWTKPHIIALDEPTNYLDRETVAALAAALRTYKGGVFLISHHEKFVEAVAKEHWKVGPKEAGGPSVVECITLAKPKLAGKKGKKGADDEDED